MIVIPKINPVLKNLNSYYVDILKLLEHLQGEIGTGGIYFKSSSVEGAVFFGSESFLSGFYIGEEGRMIDMDDLNPLLKEARTNNFLLNVYSISPEKIYFWSQISRAERIYQNLSSEFTELKGLIRKMSAEKLTGYIEVVSAQKNGAAGIIFFKSGENIGGSYSWGNGALDKSKESLLRLISESQESGGVFHVYKIDLKRKTFPESPPPSVYENFRNKAEKSTGIEEVVRMLEELLGIFENIYNSDAKTKENFSTALKKKFVEKVDRYDFLDPFAAEFEYSAQKITFSGEADNRELAVGVIECILEMAEESGVLRQLRLEAARWSENHHDILTGMGLNL